MPLGMFEMSLQQAIELKEKAQTATSNQLKDCGKQLGPLLKGQGVVHLARTQRGVC
jgi:hypothetical protein